MPRDLCSLTCDQSLESSSLGCGIHETQQIQTQPRRCSVQLQTLPRVAKQILHRTYQSSSLWSFPPYKYEARFPCEIPLLCIISTHFQFSSVSDDPAYCPSLLQVQSAGVEFRKAALRAFSRLVQNTGCVVDPYRRYPTLLSSLLSSLRFEVDVSVRLEVEALLGTVGAINPGDFKNAALPSLVGFSEISATESGGSVKYIGIKENERGVWENTPHQITSMTVNAAGEPPLYTILLL